MLNDLKRNLFNPHYTYVLIALHTLKDYNCYIPVLLVSTG